MPYTFTFPGETPGDIFLGGGTGRPAPPAPGPGDRCGPKPDYSFISVQTDAYQPYWFRPISLSLAWFAALSW